MEIKSIEELKEYNSEYHSKEEKKDNPVFVIEWWGEWIFEQTKFEDFKGGVDAMVKFTQHYEEVSYYEAVIRTTNNMKYIHNRWSKDDDPFMKNFNKLIIQYFGYNITKPWYARS